METELKKRKSNPIKRIGLSIKPEAKQIVIQIANALGLKVRYDYDESGNIIGVSAYAGNCLRLSDHCTYLQTWVDAGTWDSPYKYDIVIEDTPTVAQTQVEKGYDFTVTEFVSNTNEMNVAKAKMIAYDIREAVNTGCYANNVRAEKRTLTANHGEDTDKTQSISQTNESRTIKESQLRNIIAESIRKVLFNRN